MAGLWSAGRVGIDVEPVTTGFYAKLDAELARAAGKEIEVTANLDLDDGSARRRLREWDGKTAELRIKADDSQVRRLVSQWNGKNLNAKLDLDTKKFKRELSDVEGELKKVRNQTSWQKYWWDKSVDSAEKYTKLLERQKQLTKQQSNLLKNEINNRMSAVRSMQDAILKTSPLGASNVFDQQDANKIVARYRQMLKQVEKNPARVKLMLDDANYRTVIARLEKVTREKAKVAEENSRVRLYLDGADKLEARLKALERTRLTIPAEIKVEQENMIRRLRETAERVRLNPDAKYEVNLDVDMKRAEERIKKFKDDNDTLNMDVDLETAAARAHLMYFTRPRTVDIFARFRGTDMGKILNGMTYGASGLKGVENQFQRLVNLMDTLDTKVPKFAILGSTLISIGAGATNLAGTIGGLSKSIISLSKAAYAAPAAFTGLAAVYSTFKMIYGDKGTTWAENIDFASTKLSNLSESVQKAFYGVAKPAIMDTANAIGDSLVPEMSTLAKHEGEIVDKLMYAVRTSYQMNELPVIFDRVNESMDNLVPGAESLITALSKIGAAGGKYLPEFSNWLSKNASYFSAWATEVLEHSDRVDKAMAGVKEQAGYLGSSVKSLMGIFDGTFGTLAKYENGIQGFSETLQKMNDAVHSIRFQQTLESWIDGAQIAQGKVRDSFSNVGEYSYMLRDSMKQAFADAGTVVGSTISEISRLLGHSKSGIQDFTSGIASGWSTAIKAFGDSSGVFNSLLTMVGKLSNAFGSTLAASLKSAAPTIEAIADVTSTVADAISKIPDPLKGALGLWATFGRTGKSAWTALKVGALENIQKTLQYQSTLRQLGVTVDSTKVKMTQLWQATAKLQRNAYTASATGNAMAYGNVAGLFTGISKGAEQASKSMSNLSPRLTSVVTTLSEVERTGKVPVNNLTESISRVGTTVETTGGKFASFKTKVTGALEKVVSSSKNVGSVLLEMAGGWSGLAGMAGIGALTYAFSDYSQHAQNVKQVSEDVSQAISNIATASHDTANELGSVGTAIQHNLSANSDAGRTAWQASFIGKATTGSVFGDFKDTSDAISRLNKGLKTNKVNMTDMSKAVAGTNGEYQKFVKQLDSANAELNNPNVGLIESIRNGDSVRAYEDVKNRTAELREEIIQQAKQTAVANGYSEKRVDTLLNEGESLDQISAKIQTATQKQENHTQALKLLNQVEKNSVSSRIAANSAGATYNSTLQGLGDTIKTVKELMESGQSAWDDQAKNFNLTTEAGREASNAFGTLSTNAQNYISAMIDNGDSLDKVTAKNNEMRQSIYDTAMQMFNNKDIAKALQDQYALTPEEVETEFKAHVAQAKLDCAEYLNLIRDTFPDGTGTKTYTAIMKAITKGAVTDINEVQALADKLADGKHEIVYTADNKAVVVASDEATQAIMKVPASKDAYLNAIISGKSDADALKDAIDAIPETKDAYAKAKAEGKSDIDALAEVLKALPTEKNTELTATDNTGAGVTSGIENLDKFNQKFGKVNSDLNATDNTSGATNSAKGNISSVPSTHDTGVNAQDNTGGATGSAKGNIKSVPTSHDTSFGASVSSSFGGAVGSALNWIKQVPTSITTWFHGIFSKEGDGKATGGRIYGPGTDTSDNIPLWVSPGEAVIRAAALRKLDAKYGAGFFNYLNANGDIPLKYRGQATQAKTASVQSNGVKYRSQIQRFANGGRVQSLRNGWNVVVNPEVKVDGGKGTVVNQTFNTKVVRSNDDLYAAAPILHRNALAEARRFQR